MNPSAALTASVPASAVKADIFARLVTLSVSGAQVSFIFIQDGFNVVAACGAFYLSFQVSSKGAIALNPSDRRYLNITTTECAQALSQKTSNSDQQPSAGSIPSSLIAKPARDSHWNVPDTWGSMSIPCIKNNDSAPRFATLKTIGFSIFDRGDIRPGRSTSDLRSYLLTLKGRLNVKVVCIDLSSPYRSIIQRFFPNARIVADRFHVVRIIYHHFMTLARAVAPELKNHRGGLAAMRKRPVNLTPRPQSKLQKLFNQYPALKPIHTQMHQLRRLMNRKHQTKRQCKRNAKVFYRHINQLQYSDLKPLLTLAKTLLDWKEPIACMWRFVKNNGITEGFHRKMKLIQRRAYGFRNFENYRLRVIAQCG